MIGYFAQNQASLLDEELTVFQTIDDVAKGDIRTKIKDILGAFMFGGENSAKKVKVLSGGERTRLAMIKLLLESVNLLILDEPTNHLDLKTKDILKTALKEFDGTLIVVSHDRDFLNGLVDKVYEFGNKRVIEHLGGIYDFFIQHTSAGLTINENADPSVRTDFERSFNHLIPENQSYYTHVLEGSDDMPAHLKSSVIGVSLTVPIRNKKLALGIWQGIYLCEFRDYGGPRKLIATIWY